MHQGDKLGTSAIGELARSKDNFAINTFHDGVNLMNKLRSVVKKIEVNPTNRRNYDKVLQDHMHILTNAFKKFFYGTRMSAI